MNYIRYGGTNAHVVLEEAPHAQRVTFPRTGAPHVLTLSAHNKETLDAIARQYVNFLDVGDINDGELGKLLLNLGVGESPAVSTLN